MVISVLNVLYGLIGWELDSQPAGLQNVNTEAFIVRREDLPQRQGVARPAGLGLPPVQVSDPGRPGQLGFPVPVAAEAEAPPAEGPGGQRELHLFSRFPGKQDKVPPGKAHFLKKLDGGM